MYVLDYTISDAEVEKTYNHVHHATTLCILEKARLSFLEHIGFPNNELIANGLFLVLTSLQVDYKRELFAGPVRVTCEDMEVSGKRFSVKQRIIKLPSEKDAITARVEFVAMDGATKRAVRAPDELTAAFVG